MQIFAHRGSSGTRPENTLPAFAEAVRLGVDGIELDVQLTKDNQLVVMHDEEVNRTTDGKGLIVDKTLAELKMLNAGSWFSPEFAASKVPTLKEVLDLLNMRNFRGILGIEIKTENIEYKGIEKLVAELMMSQHWSFIYWYSSFNPSTLERIHQLDPQTRLDYIIETSDDAVREAIENPMIQGIHPNKTWVFEHETQIKELPLAVRPWTINSEEEIKRCLVAGVTGIFTDFPEKAMAIKRKGIE